METKGKGPLVYVHGVEWCVDVRGQVVPKFNNKRPVAHCYCEPGKGKSCGHHLLKTFPNLWRRFRVPVLWLRVSRRAQGRCMVNWKGSGAIGQGLGILKAWGFGKDAVKVRGMKEVEVFVGITRTDIKDRVFRLKCFLTHPASANHLRPCVVEGDKNKGRWTDGTKETLLQGELDRTTLPRFGGCRYFLKIYRVNRTPSHPVKVELVMKMPDNEYMPKRYLRTVTKAMGQLLLGICQAVDVETLPLHPGRRRWMYGQWIRVEGRGKAMPNQKQLVKRAAAVIDGIVTHWQGRLVAERDEMKAALCLALGRPLSPNTIAELLNKSGAFNRVGGTYQYLTV